MNAKEEAEKLLPCYANEDGEWCRVDDVGNKFHDEMCPHRYRSAVAAALEARDKEIERLENALLLCQGELNLALDFKAERDELARLDERFECGHRKVDFDDSYGECVFCKIKQMADDYDKLPHDVIACHDEIEQLKAEIARLNLALLRIGERAVVDFDSETVGLVDAAVKHKHPETYAEVLKAEYEQVAGLRAEIERLKTQVTFALRYSRVHRAENE